MAFPGDVDTVLGIVNAVGVVAGLFFTGFALQRDSKMRRLENLISLTDHHREIWTLIFDRPGLHRVMSDDATVVANTLSEEEELFSTFVILHVQIVFEGLRDDLLRLERTGWERDLKLLLHRPVIKEVWRRIRNSQNSDFRRYIDGISTAGVEETAAQETANY